MTRARDLSSILAADGSLNISTSVNLADNEKAYFGTSNDLQIYHSGTQSYIDENGDGNLYIRTSGAGILLKDSTGAGSGNDMASFTVGGGANLAYNGSWKLATTSTGVDVTGTVTASGDIIRNDATTGTSKFALQYGGSDAAVFKRNNSTGVATIANGYAGAPVDVININLAGNVGIGTSSPIAKLHVFGDVGDGLRLDRNNTGAVGNQIAFRHSNAGTLTETASINAISTANADTGTLAFYTKASGGSNTERMRINSSGNVGIGNTPETWYSTFSALQIGANKSAIYGRSENNSLSLASNSYVNASGNNTYINSSEASLYEQNSGVHKFFTAPSGTAGNGITFTERMHIGSSGNVGIGNSNPQFKLHLNNLVTIPNVRYLTDFFGTFEVTAANHHVMISVDDDTSTANPKAVGITLHNESQTDNTFAPAITWGNQSNSGSFSQSTAAIAARRTTQGNDANWHGGELYFYTAVSSGGVGLRTRMIIDDAGRVTMPYQPSFMAYGSWNYQASTYIWQGFATVDHNIGSHWNNSIGRFTATVAGRYMIYATAHHSAISTYHLWAFLKNGGLGGGNWVQSYDANSGSATTSKQQVFNLAAGDYLEVASNATYPNGYTGGYVAVGVYLIG